jgi:hypothetical protein
LLGPGVDGGAELWFANRGMLLAFSSCPMALSSFCKSRDALSMSRCWVCSRSRSFCGDCMRSLFGVLVVGDIIFVEVLLEGGNLTVFPEPGRSDKPPLTVDFKLGIPDTDCPRSLRFLTGLWDLTVTSSGFPATDLGRTVPERAREVPGEFSFRAGICIGEPSRVGVGMDDVCLAGDGVVREGVLGSALDCRLSRDPGRGVCGDHKGTSSASCNVLRSLKEERRFLRGGPAVDGTSPIVPRAPTNARPLPPALLFAAFPFSKLKAPSTVGRSREEGRLGEIRPVSIEFERPTPRELGKLGG